MPARDPLIVMPPGSAIVLPPRLLPSPSYYALMARYPQAVADWSGRYDRSDKATHRFTIADTRGPLSLTVPIARPEPGSRWADVVLSDHGRWQQTLPTALESAYGRTPFYEFYADRFIPVIAGARGGDRLCDFVEALDTHVRAILGITTSFTRRLTPADTEAPADRPSDYPSIAPYWQVRRDTLGFIPGLSVLDLIFNLGPEATLLLG